MSYKKQELLAFREHMSAPRPRYFGRVRVAHLFSFFVLSYYVSLRSEFRFAYLFSLLYCPIMCLYVLSSVLLIFLVFCVVLLCVFTF